MFRCSSESGFEQLKGTLPGLRLCAGHLESESSALVTLPTKVSSVAFLRNPRKTSGFLLARWRACATLGVWPAATLHLSAPVETQFPSLGSGYPACMWYPRLPSGSEREEWSPQGRSTMVGLSRCQGCQSSVPVPLGEGLWQQRAR